MQTMLTSKLFVFLTRSWHEPIAIMTDIKSKFHLVRMSRSHIEFLHFVWWPDSDINKTPVEHRIVVHLFSVLSSSSCTNFALRQTAKDNNSCFSSKVVSTIERNF